MNSLTKLPALVKREWLEHSSLWRVPLLLLVLSLLIKLAMSFGNLAFEADFSDMPQINQQFDDFVDSGVEMALPIMANTMNNLVILIMFIVAVFYALASLYNERQDNSVLFWRSLPVSDSASVLSKLLVAVVLVPIIVLVTQTLNALIFFNVDAVGFIGEYFTGNIVLIINWLFWSLLPVTAWCLLCSASADKNPFLMALIIPLLLVVVDKLFFNGVIGKAVFINRLNLPDELSPLPLIGGFVFSLLCTLLAIAKRSQRF